MIYSFKLTLFLWLSFNLFTIKVTSQCDASFSHYDAGNGYLEFYSTTGTPIYFDFGTGIVGPSITDSLNPYEYLYETNGVYTVCAYTYDSISGNFCDTICQTINATGTQCNITAGFTYTILSNGTVTIQNTSSPGYWCLFEVGDLAPFSNEIDVDPAVPNFGVTYYNNGNYATYMSITDYNVSDFTCERFFYDTIVISGISCQDSASFTSSLDSNGIVNFTNTSTKNAKFTFDGGIFNNINLSVGGQSSYQFTSNGIHTICAITSDINGCTDTLCYDYNITNACSTIANIQVDYLPQGNVNYINLSTGDAWLRINSSSDSTLILQNDTLYHSFLIDALYPTVVYVGDSTGCYHTYSFYTNISNACNIIAYLNPTLDTNGTVHYSWGGTGGNSFPIFNDGYTNNAYGGSFTSPTITTVQYDSNGVYYPYVRIDNSNCTRYFYDTITISNVNCYTVANISYQIYNNGIVTFINTSSYDGLLYTSDTATTAIPIPAMDSISYAYLQNGFYTYSFYISDTNSTCSDSTSGNFLITNIVNPCVAYYDWVQAYDSLNGSWSNNVYVIDYSAGNNLQYLWDFGDSSTSNIQYPNHIYAGSGPYTVCLTISNSTCSNTFCDTIVLAVKTNVLTLNVISENDLNSLSVGNIENKVELYPNPTKIGYFIVENKGRHSFVLYNSVGVKIDNGNFTSTLKYNVSNLKNGLYFILIDDNLIRKIIKGEF